ncbi:Spt23p KNAG_0H00190 [Huiozyma naganishii CBS 8797]|uniref:IPT/TIG domain-containing protein n=1 Tax=Huiozyma naganishii (strain ATCC MYA-139 / BCRC 22969 / CBS 8797 / KCTC 17520 / NBRC 10181 / NCYC 3082 / Yp74L-3) TaxID=1071383 RepID=J7R994_HUIN7|nr:hypothetical protein KNAG_0H00190 [Kazachstania naganishii CBS 8797]CCK71435.1 hypothetical protein KNAG_0H00190 [Kazachstania naganishii CBS 8797]
MLHETAATNTNNAPLETDLDCVLDEFLGEFLYLSRDSERGELLNLTNSNEDDGSVSGTTAVPSFYESLSFRKAVSIKTSAPTDQSKVAQINEQHLSVQMTTSNLPSYSRVENQIKLDVKLVSNTGELADKLYAYLPADCIAKEKFYLDESNVPTKVKKSVLYVEAFLLTYPSEKATYVCDRCVQREQRRASRRKSGLCDNVAWCANPNRSAVIFNNKQLLKLESSGPNEINFQLNTRIVCYCRHHKSPLGFHILFLIRDCNQNIIAKHTTTPIIIMDKKTPTRAPTGEKQSFFDHKGTLRPQVRSCKTPNDYPDSISMPFHNSIPSPTSQSDDNLYADNLRAIDINTIDSNWNDYHSHLGSNKNNIISPVSEINTVAKGTTGLELPIASAEPLKKRKKTYSASPVSSVSSVTSEPLSRRISTNSGSLASASCTNAVPLLHRLVPAQGSTAGGIEVTLLGSNFKQGLIVKFGDNIALSSQCWNSTTIVTYLPPSATTGQVLVTIADPMAPQQPVPNYTRGPFFTYIDDSDKQIIELALQIVGFKMNGKLDDPRNIARQIVDSTNSQSATLDGHSSNQSMYTQNHTNVNVMGTQDLLVKIIEKAVDLNFAVMDAKGRTLLHYAALKKHKRIVELLVQKSGGVLATREDSFGFLPLHFASVGGDSEIINLLSKFNGANRKAGNGMTPNSLYFINHELNMDDSESSCDEFTETESSVSEAESLEEDRVTEAQEENAESNPSLYSRLMSRFGEDLLPRYDDLFPKNSLDDPKSAKIEPAGTSEQEQSISQLGDYETDSESRENEDDDESYEHLLMFHKEVNFENDKMLLYFWIPLMLLSSTWVTLYLWGANDSWVHWLNDQIAKYARILLTSFLLGRERMRSSIKSHFSNFQPSRILKDFSRSLDDMLVT